MSTPDLIRIVGKNADVSQVNTGAVIKAYHALMAAELQKGHSVVITGIGTFTIKTMPARMGVNPQTGKKMKLAARNKASFKPFPSLKKAINNED